MLNYETSYAREYRRQALDLVEGYRPQSRGIHGPAPYKNDYSTSYKDEFPERSLHLALPYQNNAKSRAGRNYEIGQTKVKLLKCGMCPANTYDDASYRKAIKGKLVSTYNRDFLGLPQGTPLEDQNLYVDPCSFDFTRGDLNSRQMTYVPLPEELKLPTSRHGSNTDRQPAKCSVPGNSSNVIEDRRVTIYNKDFTDWRNAPSVTKSLSAKPHGSSCPAISDLFITY